MPTIAQGSSADITVSADSTLTLQNPGGYCKIENPIGTVIRDGGAASWPVDVTAGSVRITAVTGGVWYEVTADPLWADGIPVLPTGDTTGAQDSAAIEAAISRIAGSGGVVRLSAGTYYISSPIVLSAVSHITIAGIEGTVVKLADNQAAAVPGDMVNIVEIGSSSDIRLTGIRFDGNCQNQNMANLAMSFGDLAQGASGNRRDPFTIRYVGAGSAASLTIAGGVLTTTCTGASGDNLSIDLAAAGYDTIAELVAYIDGLAAYQATAVHTMFGAQLSARLYATTIADIKTAAVGVNFTNSSNAGTHEIYGNCVRVTSGTRVMIDHCDLSYAPHMGVLITGNSSECVVEACTGSYNNWRACELWPNSGTISTRNRVVNNTFANSYHDSIGVEFPGTFRNVVSHNSVLLDDLTFNDGENCGIKIYESTGNVVSGNTLRGCFVIVEQGSASYNVIANNTIDGRDSAAVGYVTRGVYIRSGVGNVVVGNTCIDPYYDTIRVQAAASKTVVRDNVLTGNDNASRYPLLIEAGCADTYCSGNVLSGNTNGVSDLGTRTILDGLGANGSNDPASAGGWSGNGRAGVHVAWDNGAGKKRLSVYSAGAWVNYYVEP